MDLNHGMKVFLKLNLYTKGSVVQSGSPMLPERPALAGGRTISSLYCHFQTVERPLLRVSVVNINFR